jgi:hypothetical protein
VVQGVKRRRKAAGESVASLTVHEDQGGSERSQDEEVRKYVHLSKKNELALVAILLLVQVTLAISSVINKSSTFDEMAHITKGLSIWERGDFRLVPEHPPLVHLCATLPTRLAPPEFVSATDPAWRSSNVNSCGQTVFYGLAVCRAFAVRFLRRQLSFRHGYQICKRRSEHAHASAGGPS